MSNLNITREDIEKLNKALSAGYSPDPVTQALLDTFHRLDLPKPKLMTGFGGILRVEDLESTLKTVTFDVKDIKIWPKPGKKK